MPEVVGNESPNVIDERDLMPQFSERDAASRGVEVLRRAANAAPPGATTGTDAKAKFKPLQRLRNTR